jgi:hypothetical protein
MEGKLKGKPMVAILGFLEATGEFEICPFNNDMILNQPIEKWIRCDVLLAFYSHGFPLKRAIEYVKMFKPVLINDLESQTILWDRTQVNDMLRSAGIPTARCCTVVRNETVLT